MAETIIECKPTAPSEKEARLEKLSRGDIGSREAQWAEVRPPRGPFSWTTTNFFDALDARQLLALIIEWVEGVAPEIASELAPVLAEAIFAIERIAWRSGWLHRVAAENVAARAKAHRP
jgi:hypothetical protein